MGANEELVKMAMNFKNVENSEKNRTELLKKAYIICCPDGFKMEGYEGGISREAQQLADGKKTLDDSSVKELVRNRIQKQQWVHYNEAPEVINNTEVKADQKQMQNVRQQIAHDKGNSPKIEMSGPKMTFNMGPQGN
jgi:hypothetical protein